MNLIMKFIFGSSIASTLFFTAPLFQQNDSRIFISGELRGVVTEKVERIINTGSEVRIVYYVAIYAVENKRTVLFSKKIVNSIRYDNLDDLFILNLNGKSYFTASREDAFRRAGFYRAEFEKPVKNNYGFGDLYIDASIEYNSSLKSGIPGTTLWEYYVPNLKVPGIIRFERI